MHSCLTVRSAGTELLLQRRDGRDWPEPIRNPSGNGLGVQLSRGRCLPRGPEIGFRRVAMEGPPLSLAGRAHCGINSIGSATVLRRRDLRPSTGRPTRIRHPHGRALWHAKSRGHCGAPWRGPERCRGSFTGVPAHACEAWKGKACLLAGELASRSVQNPPGPGIRRRGCRACRFPPPALDPPDRLVSLASATVT